jgi:uncharacterized protein YeaO (DUF488 family)
MATETYTGDPFNPSPELLRQWATGNKEAFDAWAEAYRTATDYKEPEATPEIPEG